MSNLTVSGSRSSLQPFSNLAEMIEDQNRLSGGNNPLLQEATDVLRSTSEKPNPTYYEFRNHTEFYHPYLSLGDVMRIASMHLDKRFYSGSGGGIRQAKGPLAFSTIELGRYSDQYKIIYEQLLQTHPEEPRRPLPSDNSEPLFAPPKFSDFRNLFRSSEEIQQELHQREKGQNRIIQKIIAYVKSLNDPAIESIVHPTPDEAVDRYGSTLLGAATHDAVIIIHRKVRPNEERFQAHLREWRAKRDQEERAERQHGEFLRLHPEIHASDISPTEEATLRTQNLQEPTRSNSSPSKKGLGVFFCPSATQSETQSKICSDGSSAGYSSGEKNREENMAAVNRPNAHLRQEADYITRQIFTASQGTPKKIVYQNDIKTLVAYPSQSSVLRRYFPRDEVVFGYGHSQKDIWYSVPLLVSNGEERKVIVYHSNIPRAVNLPEYTPSEDRLGRKYLLVPVNNGKGYVPVRHGTDPVLENWLSLSSRIKVVYDSNGLRHPAMEGIDYAAHGFKLLRGKIWWSLLGGKFKPTYKRVKEPYFKNYNQLFIEPEKPGILGRIGTFLAGFSGGVPQAAMAQQIVRSEADQEAIQQGRAQEGRRIEFQLQKNVLDCLDKQDSLDLSEEISQRLQQNASFEEIQALFHQNAEVQILPEHRGKIAKQAALFGRTRELGLILENGPISGEDRAQVLIDSVDQGNLANIQLLLRGNPPFHTELYGKATIRAAKLGHRDILQQLLAREILPEDRGQAVIEAVERGSAEDVDLLLQSGTISTEKRGQAVIHSCQQELAFLQKLLNHGLILIEDRGKAATEAVKNWKFEHMRLLISSSIFLEHRGQAAIAAARNGRNDIVNELMASGPISPEHKVEIMRIQQNQ